MSCYGCSEKKYSGIASSGYGAVEKSNYTIASRPISASYATPDRSLGLYDTHALSAQNQPMLEIDDHGLPTYPSYLGVPITEPFLGEALLGQTNGRRINITADIDPQIRNFVLMHEEEHVKDMSASEFEIDKRAVQRLIRSKKHVSWVKIKLLLKSRWQEKSDLLLSDETAAELICQ